MGKIMSKEDKNNDQKIDTLIIDMNGNGLIDKIMKDTNFDGRFDMAIFDQNENELKLVIVMI